jgi:hypothetical protein
MALSSTQPAPTPDWIEEIHEGGRYGLAGAMTIAKQATAADFDWD